MIVADGATSASIAVEPSAPTYRRIEDLLRQSGRMDKSVIERVTGEFRFVL